MFFHAARIILVLSVALPGLLVASSANAQTLERAERDYRRGQFRRANRSVTAALEAEELTRDQLVSLTELRARVALALGDEDAMAAAAAILASLDPQRELAPEIRPELRAAFEAARDEQPPLGVVVDVQRGPAHATLTARVEHDRGEITTGVRVHARVGGGEWQMGEPSIEIEVPDTEDVDYRALVLGPGASVLVELGTEETPQVHAGREPVVVPVVLPPVVPEASDEADVPLIVGLSVGGAVALGAIIGIIAVTTSGGGGVDPNSDTPVEAPMITLWSVP